MEILSELEIYEYKQLITDLITDLTGTDLSTGISNSNSIEITCEWKGSDPKTGRIQGTDPRTEWIQGTDPKTGCLFVASAPSLQPVSSLRAPSS